MTCREGPSTKRNVAKFVSLASRDPRCNLSSRYCRYGVDHIICNCLLGVCGSVLFVIDTSSVIPANSLFPCSPCSLFRVSCSVYPVPCILFRVSCSLSPSLSLSAEQLWSPIDMIGR